MSARTKIFLVISLFLGSYLILFATYWFKVTEKERESLKDFEAIHADFNAYYEKLYGKEEDNIELPDSADLVKAMKLFDGSAADTGATLKPSGAGKAPPKIRIPPKTPTKKPKVAKRFINQKNNPFELLGVYEETSSYILDPHYDEVHYGIENKNDYCKFVDMVNINGPHHLYSPKGFVFTDFSKNSLVHDAISNFSQNIISKGDIDGYIQNYKVTKKGTPLNPFITNFFTSFDRFYNYHKIGQNFLCESQMSNHIPGQEQLARKDFFIDNMRQYSEKYLKRPQCFDEKKFVPETFRLFKKEECLAFFEILGSEKYQKSTKENPVQYVVKIDEGTYKWENLHLLDEDKTLMMQHLYQNGSRCGQMIKAILVQKYITNPLLLDRNNRFDLRAYMLVASTNPLTVFYRDGYLKVSSRSFNKSDDNINQLPSRNLAAKELKEESQFWTFGKLENYLLESKKIKDKKWLNDYLRPALQKAFIHMIRMTSSSFWKKSNVYELFEMEFVLDENLQLWFIESKPTPSFGGAQPKFIEKMLSDLFEIEYAFYRSRMVRVMELLRKVEQDSGKFTDKKAMQKWKTQYNDATFNRLEPQFIPMIGKTNEWKLILTERFKGVKAYLGHLTEKCI